MKRKCIVFLDNWLISTDRKPLIIRGARQVGKTWLVRYFAQAQKKRIFEINFEKKPEWASLFDSNNPAQILLMLGTVFNEKIVPEESLLFLDEIQAAPEVLAKLRWFAEELPELPIIAAGSLLEFVLADHSFSMPVGRISYMYLEPMSFEEFLMGNEKTHLLEFLANYQLKEKIPEIINDQLMSYFKEYIFVGGMPAAVLNWIKNRSPQEIQRIHHDLLATYRDDFAKYSGRMSTQRLEEVMMAVPKYLGEKFVYTRVNTSIQIAAIKQALDLLCKAKICHQVLGSSANGIPLGAEIQEKYKKVIFIDSGLCSVALGLHLDQLYSFDDINLINKGGIAEQVTGQILRTTFPYFVEPSLYYWHKEEKGSSAEIDYVIQHRNKVIPIEVKSGSTGTLKSLHSFMKLKNLSMAVRINSDYPTLTDVSIKDHTGSQINYQLISLPFYLIGQIHRLLENFDDLENIDI